VAVGALVSPWRGAIIGNGCTVTAGRCHAHWEKEQRWRRSYRSWQAGSILERHTNRTSHNFRDVIVDGAGSMGK
jgi:hypothetical protein